MAKKPADLLGYELSRWESRSGYTSHELYLKVRALTVLGGEDRAYFDRELAREGHPPVAGMVYQGTDASFELKWSEHREWERRGFSRQSGPYLAGYIEPSERHESHAKIDRFLAGARLLERTLRRAVMLTLPGKTTADDVGDWLIDDPYYLVRFLDRIGAPRIEAVTSWGKNFVEAAGPRLRLRSEGLARMMTGGAPMK